MDTLTINDDHLHWQFDDHLWARLPPAGGRMTSERVDNGVVVSNGAIRAMVDVLGRVTYSRKSGERLLKELWRQRDAGEPFWSIGTAGKKSIGALKIDGREIRPLAGEAFELTARFESAPGEKIYGMGQYQQPGQDLKGCVLELAQRNSQASAPFALSNLGYGVLWNNPAAGEVVFAKNETRWHAKATPRRRFCPPIWSPQESRR